MGFVIHRVVGDQTLLRQVTGDELRIGRGAAAGLRLEDDAVALEHAVIRAVAGGWELSDLGSVTGTYVAGRPVETVRLAGGETVEIGGFRLRVQVTHPDDPLFVHVAAVSAGAAASPRRARGAATGALRLPSGAAAVAATGSAAVLPGVRATAPGATAPGAAPPTPTPPATAAPAAPRVREVDWLGAYRVGRGIGMARLTVVLTLVAALAVAALLAAGATAAFMPGISSAHQRLVDAAAAGGASSGPSPAASSPAASSPVAGSPVASSPLASNTAPAADPRALVPAVRGCAACHLPWRGPVETGCAECHRPQTAPHADRATSAAAPARSAPPPPPCRSCHPEHRPGEPLVSLTDNAPCAACHGTLPAPVRATSFAADHPELAPPAGRVAAAAAAANDLDFGHRKHLAPGLRGPAGPETLECAACHTADPETGRMRPIAFADHCQRCHRLTFDPAFPDREAPHGDPQAVEDYLVGLYSRGGEEAAGSLRQRRLSIIRGGGRRELPAGVDRRVSDAARTLFGAACDTCHRVDLDAEPRPTVVPPKLPGRWFEARFSHLDHQEAACTACHAGAAASDATADLLLPRLADCRACHGAGPAADAAAGDGATSGAGWGGRLGCAQCHAYHPPPAAVTTAAVSTAPVSTAPVSATTALTAQRGGE